METKGFLFPGGENVYLFLSGKVSLKREKVTFQILLSPDPSSWIQDVN